MDIHEPAQAVCRLFGIPFDDLTSVKFEQEVGDVAHVVTTHLVFTADNTVESVDIVWKPAPRAHFRYLRLKFRRRIARWWK